MVRRLRLRRISPAMLARKLKSKNKVAVLDLLDFEDETATESPEGYSRVLLGLIHLACGSLHASVFRLTSRSFSIPPRGRYRKRTSSHGIATNRR